MFKGVLVPKSGTVFLSGPSAFSDSRILALGLLKIHRQTGTSGNRQNKFDDFRVFGTSGYMWCGRTRAVWRDKGRVEFLGPLGTDRTNCARPKPYKFIGFGSIHGPKPYKFIGFGSIHGPKPYK